MKRMCVLTGLALICSVMAWAAPGQEGSHTESEPPSIEGSWEGSLDAGGQTLRLVLKVTSTEGELSAVLISVDQGNVELAVDTITLDGTQLTFEIKQVYGGYQGTVSASGDQIDGTWSQGGNTLPLLFTRSED